jgi:KaiC/GvpD/RAD55 family RecA-like ATPase
MELIRWSTVTAQEIEWLWYPYIPKGKVTVVQGDPCEGKTTFLLAVASALTTGTSLPGSSEPLPRSSVIFQSAEDGIADTLLVRLAALGGDSSMVCTINESEQQLSFLDERIEQAIKDTGAKLFIFDPMQAFMADIDMHRANEVRPLFNCLGNIAERTGCAIMLIGHFNKMSGTKPMYRGLGSADINAAVRSVLIVGRLKDEPQTRVVAHLKSNLAPEGKSIAFTLGEDGFEWAGTMDITADELLNGSGSCSEREPTKKEVASALLLEYLSDGAMPVTEIIERLDAHGISKRTADNAKAQIGAKSKKLGSGWAWYLEGGDADTNE